MYLFENRLLFYACRNEIQLLPKTPSERHRRQAARQTSRGAYRAANNVSQPRGSIATAATATCAEYRGIPDGSSVACTTVGARIPVFAGDDAAAANMYCAGDDSLHVASQSFNRQVSNLHSVHALWIILIDCHLFQENYFATYQYVMLKLN